jgi:hypothetical protein
MNKFLIFLVVILIGSCAKKQQVQEGKSLNSSIKTEFSDVLKVPEKDFRERKMGTYFVFNYRFFEISFCQTFYF